MEVDRQVIPKIAFGFAGGIGQTGAVCGAVAGGVMAISLVQDKGQTMEEGLRELALTREFRRRFEAEMKAITCRELTGVDMTNEEELDRYMKSDTPQKVCFPAVSLAYQLAVDLLQQPS